MNVSIVLLIILLIFSLYTDLKKSVIPNVLTVSTVFLGVVSCTIQEQTDGFLKSFGGALTGLLIMYVLYLFNALGAGDVKLFAAIGALMGIEFVLYAIMYSIIFAGAAGILILIARRDGRERFRAIFYRLYQLIVFKRWKTPSLSSPAQLTFPFMIAVVPGVFMTMYYFELVHYM